MHEHIPYLLILPLVSPSDVCLTQVPWGLTLEE